MLPTTSDYKTISKRSYLIAKLHGFRYFVIVKENGQAAYTSIMLAPSGTSHFTRPPCYSIFTFSFYFISLLFFMVFYFSFGGEEILGGSMISECSVVGVGPQ